MANTILTPLSIWRTFDDKQPLNSVVLQEDVENEISYSYVSFSGRKTEQGLVKIFSAFAKPTKEGKFPTLLILPDLGKSIDVPLMNRFVKRGYAVLMLDYAGHGTGAKDYTQYPDDISFANYNSMGRKLNYVDTEATDTCWYEWVSVGLYAIQYLRQRDDVGKIGVLGIRIGGEIAWKLMLSPNICCGIPICSAGWLAYKGINKFGHKETELPMDYERHRFIAGIDSQAYAPFVRCPVLMLCSTNDTRFDYDRAFDTYSRVNPEVSCELFYSVHNNSYIDAAGVKNLDLFLDRYLKDRQVYIPRPANIVIEIDIEHDLVARISFDKSGDVKKCRVFLAEDKFISSQRDWVEMTNIKSVSNEEIVFYLNAYKDAKTVFAFASVEYSSGFSVSSKIAVKYLDDSFKNGVEKSKIMFQTSDGESCFDVADVSQFALDDCLMEGEDIKPVISEGYKGIQGISSVYGLKTYRIGNPKFSPPVDALLTMDLCSHESGIVFIKISQLVNGKVVEYCSEVSLTGSNGWKNILLSANHFKNENGLMLSGFSHAFCMTLTSDIQFLVNNILWL